MGTASMPGMPNPAGDCATGVPNDGLMGRALGISSLATLREDDRIGAALLDERALPDLTPKILTSRPSVESTSQSLYSRSDLMSLQSAWCLGGRRESL